MTTANKITILRILLVPFFVVQILYYVRSGNEVHRLLGLLAFAIAAILDGVDGYVARRYNQRSELGTLLDPLADKLLLVSAIVVLSTDHAPHLGQIPLWLTGTIIGRDILLGLGVVTVRLVVGTVTIRPRITGKISTVFQMVTVCWILLRWDFSYPAYWLKIWILAAGVFTAVSGLFYVWDGTRQLSSHPSSSATPK
ncbi:MAG TPA: CDP-diacylglycerol--glycerol-3-phosphate 3-phosphatidyltransferase [Candidatus Acidoferrales bacterium]|nr:CDP-diacylglycerol--glycerol-3-phosphate 3-phosphatidyltransferase [Candidatus Acidoferrales bacterium]